jgi:hypothetical protein
MGRLRQQCAVSLTLISVNFTVQLLHKLSIRGVNGPEKLLKVIKVGFQHDPPGAWYDRG